MCPCLQAEYDAIAEYSPYEHVRALVTALPYARYGPPALLVTAAANDSRVPWWGPVKFAAAMRHALMSKASAGVGGPTAALLLRVDLGAGGHFAPTGLLARALRIAFLLRMLPQ